MPGVSIPSQPYNPMGTIGGVVGGIVGGYFGGGAGAAAGSKIGSALGTAGNGASPGAVQGAENPDAITRRLQTQQNDPQVQLAQADAALQQLPPEYAQTYGPTIASARQAAAQGGN